MPCITKNKTDRTVPSAEEMYNVVFWKKCGLDDMEIAVLEADVLASSADQAKNAAVFALHGNLNYPRFKIEYSSVSAERKYWA